jgi:hypothetical protein
VINRDPASLYLTHAEALRVADPRLNPLSAGILAAAELGIATDSIAFCRALDISHALVLRELDMLEGDLGRIHITRRDPRTSRTFYSLAHAG